MFQSGSFHLSSACLKNHVKYYSARHTGFKIFITYSMGLNVFCYNFS